MGLWLLGLGRGLEEPYPTEGLILLVRLKLNEKFFHF